MKQEDKRKYIKQILLNEINIEGQYKINQSKVLCVGMGGLGIPSSTYLASAGVGTIGIIDNDIIDITNLHRQTIFKTTEVGEKKVDISEKFLKGLNPDIKIKKYNERLSEKNALKIMKEFDFIIDGSDNFETKFIICKYSSILSIPMIYGAITNFEGYVTTFFPNESPCYNCLYNSLPKNNLNNCNYTGTIGNLTGIIGSIQSTEVLKLILNEKKNFPFKTLLGYILIIDLKNLDFFKLKIKKMESCKICNIKKINKIKNLNYINNKLNNELIEINYKEAKKIDKIKFVDIREKGENNNKNIYNSLNFPFSEIIKEKKLNTFFKKKEKYILYCQTGKRSKIICKLLINLGYKNIYSLKNGIQNNL